MVVAVKQVAFRLEFHSPFRVGAAYGEDGVDLTIDVDEPIPSDHIKGLMRFAAKNTLSLDQTLVDRVFGSASTTSPWSWLAVEPEGDWGDPRLRNRTAIDEDTHAAKTDHLVFAHEIHSRAATITIEQIGPIADTDLPTHVALLRTSAAAIHALGGWRRRGLGWVSVNPDPPVDENDLKLLGWQGGM
ncbi:RAMP superfamily CRISPR-associated protein [Gordonia sp. NPDC062954]|uniref:RAMP superfamily CRISPR-associated protein n=1 Tax=Gordonia sp. NPDC062954 TaxID=3364003 RepID=UPI0037CAB0F7